MSQLRPGWIETTLAEVAEVRLGRQRSPKTHTGSNMRPYLRAANVTWRGLDVSDVKEMHFSPEEVETYRLRPGDLLVAEASGTRGEVGKPALWSGEIDDCCFQNTLLRVRTLGPVSKYLLYFLGLEARSGRLGNAARGVGIHHIGAAGLSSYPIPVAPLAEQERIIAAIEEQFSRIDDGLRSMSRAQRQLSTLLSASLARAARGSKELVRVVDLAADGPGAITDGPFGSNLKTEHYTPTGPRVIRLQNIGDGDFKDVEVHISLEHFERLRRYEARPRDVIIAALGEVLPRACVVPDNLGPAIVKADCFRLRVRAGVNPYFVAAMLNSPPVRAAAGSEIAGVGRPRLNLSKMKNLKVPLPSEEEQDRIAQRLTQQQSLVRSIDASLGANATRAEALRASVLRRAFSGVLVAQDPADEPASELLARVWGSPSTLQRKRRKT